MKSSIVQGVTSAAFVFIIAVVLLTLRGNTAVGFIVGNMLLVATGYIAEDTHRTYKRIKAQRLVAYREHVMRTVLPTLPPKNCGGA